jgi:hypothetical protein
MRRFSMIALLCASIAGFGINAAGAAPRNSGTTGSATLSASPNPVAAGGEYHVTGCGYTAAQVNITVTEPAATYFFGTPTSGGCINAAFWADGSPATYKITASQQSGRKTVVMKSTTLTVV